MAITISGSGITSANIADDTIVNSDINSSAAIAQSKTASLVGGDLPTGSVLQVVQATHASQVATTATSWTNMGLSASITPNSSSNKILVILDYIGAVTSDNHLYIQILRDSTSIISNPSAFFAQSAGISGGGLTLKKLDSPNPDSSVTYSGQFHTRDSGEQVLVQYGNSPSTITLMEIAG